MSQANERLKTFHTRFLAEGFVGGPTPSIADFSMCTFLHCMKAGPFFDSLTPEIKAYVGWSVGWLVGWLVQGWGGWLVGWFEVGSRFWLVDSFSSVVRPHWRACSLRDMPVRE